MRSQLLLYVEASNSVACTALVQEQIIEGRAKQMPVYIISEALPGTKLAYSELEKVVYALVMASRKLRHYFKGHPIKVFTNKTPARLIQQHGSFE